jgi:uncharacterized protein involved in high-affinity Fe2+ transport
MAENKNEHPVDGTLYSKDIRTAPNKKDPEHPYEFKSIKLETTAYMGGKTFNTIIEFPLGRGVGFDEFEVGDPITVRFVSLGKAVTPTWFKTENVAVYIQHMDIQRQGMSSKAPKEEVFVTPSIGQNEGNEDDLPF